MSPRRRRLGELRWYRGFLKLALKRVSFFMHFYKFQNTKQQKGGTKCGVKKSSRY